jgi:2-polyprenyl-3-methyl-5-hydroxy-6-metoxy-1,4-benzoquinol methylase
LLTAWPRENPGGHRDDADGGPMTLPMEFRMKVGRALRHKIDNILYPAPARIRARHLPIDEAARSRIERAMRRDYYSASAAGYLATEEGRRHLEGHVIGRLEQGRSRVIPWLTAARSLEGARILEIGCGTGSSTVALSEQGAEVVALDMNQRHIAVAKERSRALGLKPHFVVANATEAAALLPKDHFDFVIFFAALEHMRFEEREIAIRNTWSMLRPGGLWAVVETPNRLHYFDDHTAQLPFYHWLPEEVAWEYRNRSPRAVFSNLMEGEPRGSETSLRLQRFGRGISYHDFELALGPLDELEIVSSLGRYTPALRWLRRSQRFTTLKGRHQALLSKVAPELDPAFLEPWLNFIIRKP